MAIPEVVYKAHGMGNDFVAYIDLEDEFEPKPSEVKALCDRHYGIGADGLIRLTKRTGKDGIVRLFMDYSNQDGSLANMCGNGARVSALIADIAELVDMSDGKVFELDTRSGVKRIVRQNPGSYTIDMGAWRADEDRNFSVYLKGENRGKVVTGRFVDVGNEHIVCDVVNKANIGVGVRLNNLDLNTLPDVTSLHPSDSAVTVKEVGANFEFTEVDIPNKTINMRVYERGVGETLSCGTGICASAISAYLALRNDYPDVDVWRVIVPGGSARVRVLENSVLLTGPAMITAKVTLNSDFSRGLLYANR
jgi:diaminopimelate epimerase